METKKINQVKDDILRVKYHGQLIEINLTRELSLDESIINSQLRELPSNYLFLCLLRDQAIRTRDKYESMMNEALDKAWVYFKDADPKMTNDAATKRASTTNKFTSIRDKYLKAAAKAAKLSSICRAYEARERIIQTLAANIRKQQ